MKNIYNSTIKDWKKIFNLIDKNNDQDFETFKEIFFSYFDNGNYDIFDNLCKFLVIKLGKYSDSELVFLTEDNINSIIHYIKNNLYYVYK